MIQNSALYHTSFQTWAKKPLFISYLPFSKRMTFTKEFIPLLLIVSQIDRFENFSRSVGSRTGL